MNPNPNTSGLRPPWKKGDPSPNPSGRPQRLPITDRYTAKAMEPLPAWIRKKLERRGVTLPPDATCGDALAETQYGEAILGNSAAAKEIRESIEGKAGLRIEPRDTVDRLVRIILEDRTTPLKNPNAGRPPENILTRGKVDGGAKSPAPQPPEASKT